MVLGTTVVWCTIMIITIAQPCTAKLHMMMISGYPMHSRSSVGMPCIMYAISYHIIFYWVRSILRYVAWTNCYYACLPLPSTPPPLAAFLHLGYFSHAHTHEHTHTHTHTHTRTHTHTHTHTHTRMHTRTSEVRRHRVCDVRVQLHDPSRRGA